ncbi:MAG TPA: hypothetical protein VJS37_01555, partial [Terriglobales bacterium]|nr:hypothetical protein [Terriglobales bacterium]
SKMTLAPRLALIFGLFFAPLLLTGGGKSPSSFGISPEVVTFRWLPGAAVHNCVQVEERTDLTCSHIDWIRDSRQKRHWVAVCGQ